MPDGLAVAADGGDVRGLEAPAMKQRIDGLADKMPKFDIAIARLV